MNPNVPALRRHYEAFNRGDMDEVMKLFAPDAQFDNEILGQMYRGHAEIRTFFAELAEVIADYRIEPLEFIECGDQLVVPVRLGGRFRHTGISGGAPAEMAHVFTFHAGQIVRVRTCRDKKAAFEAVKAAD